VQSINSTHHNAEPFAFMGDNRWQNADRLDFAWTDYTVSVKARISGPVTQPSSAINRPHLSRLVKAVAGWQSGSGVTPDQPSGTGGERILEAPSEYC
jgi:hypothetical protein